MKKGCWLGWVVLLLCGGPAVALETMAYRFVEKPDLHPYSPGEIDPFSNELSPEPPVVEKSPDPTCFVDDGDKLVDVTEVFRKLGAPLKDGWAVWNETQRLLVVRGEEVDQWRVPVVMDFEDQLTQLRVRYEWYPRDGAPGPRGKDEEAVSSLTVVSRSGQKTSGEMVVNEGEAAGSYRVESDGVIGSGRSLIDVSCLVTWSALRDGAEQRWKMRSSVVLYDGVRRLLGGCSMPGGGDGWVLGIVADARLIDGTLWREARMREENGRAVAVPPNGPWRREDSGPVRLEEGWLLRSFDVPPDFVQGLGGGTSLDAPEIDPFAPEPDLPPGFIPQLPEVKTVRRTGRSMCAVSSSCTRPRMAGRPWEFGNAIRR